MDTSTSWLTIVLTSSAIGALVSSIINALANAWVAKKQAEIRKMGIAVKLMESKNDTEVYQVIETYLSSQKKGTHASFITNI